MTINLVPLKDVLRLSIDSVPVDASQTYPIAGVYSFGRGLLSRSPILGSETTYKTLHRLHRGDFVLSQLKGWEGALAKVTASYDGWFLSPQFPTFRAIPDRLDISYLDWYCKQTKVWDELKSTARGMGARRDSVSPERFLSLKIPLPPLPEQRRIVARIEELAAKINEVRRLRERSREEIENLCRAVLSDDPDAKLTPMNELVRLRSPDVTVQQDESYQFGGVYCFGRGVFRGQKKTGIEFAYKQLTRLKTGNFVYPKLMAWEGALGVVPPECDGCVVSTEFPVFEILEDRVLPEVLDTYFGSPHVWPELSGSSTGTNVRRRRLNPSDFLNHKIPLPSWTTQERLRAIRSKVDALTQIRAKTSAELDALLRSFLDKAFNGGS